MASARRHRGLAWNRSRSLWSLSRERGELQASGNLFENFRQLVTELANDRRREIAGEIDAGEDGLADQSLIRLTSGFPKDGNPRGGAD